MRSTSSGTRCGHGAARSLLAVICLTSGLVTGCTGQEATSPWRTTQATAPAELTVSAATSLRTAFEELAPGFEEANDARLVFNFGASGVLQKQIEGGVPCDVFASASPKQVDVLIEAGLISVDATATFASNDLAMIVPVDNPARINKPADLTHAARLVTGNPATAPHGTKAREFLEGQGMWATLEPRFIYAENAAQTLDYVSRGEIDAGFVFASEAHGNAAVKVVYTVPAGAIEPVRHVASPVMVSANATLGERFVAYLMTPEAQAVFIKNGFGPAATP